MWTRDTRLEHDRGDLRYPSDVTDAEWAILEPLLPPPSKTGRKRGWPIREVINAIFFVLAAAVPGGCCPSTSRCASRSAAILYGKEPGPGLVLVRSRCFVTQHSTYGVLSWRAIWNARHVFKRGAILQAANHASIRGVKMACNTPDAALERLCRRPACRSVAEGDMACNALPYKIAALRDAHLVLAAMLGSPADLFKTAR